MEKNWTKVIVVFLLIISSGSLIAQTPWKCDGRAIGTYNPGSNSYTDDTKLYSALFDAAGNVTYVGKTATSGIGLNGIERLLAIPRAAIRRTQFRHDLYEFLEASPGCRIGG